MHGQSSSLAVIAALSVALAVPAFAEGVRIDELVVATSIPDSQRDATLSAARAFYEFWNTGDEADLKRAIAPTFTDAYAAGGTSAGPAGAGVCVRASSALRCRIWR